MKNKLILVLLIGALPFFTLVSCKKKNRPAEVVEGTFIGSFEGKFNGKDTLANAGYGVVVTAESKEKIRVEGNDFEVFTTILTTKGLNVERVSKIDTSLVSFIYISDEKKLKFVYKKGLNRASFIGTQQ